MRKSIYSEEFQRAVVNEVSNGILNKEEARIKYGIKGNSAVLSWIRKFDASKTKVMTSSKTPNLSGKSREELEAENRRLREELEMEQLRTRALNVMIDIAEERFDLPIRKKPGAKQWKK
ncbi:MAG TPA: transposase [Draconibacterium sp.]|jgi:transposase|nr:transposase [Draconibacterium sp.]